jgi:hypothetical protein
MTLRSLGITVSRNMPMPIDPQRSATELDVEAKARSDAQRDVLAACPSLTPTELEIDAYHEELLRSRTAELASRLAEQRQLQTDKRVTAEQPDFDGVVHDAEHRADMHTTVFKDTTAELQEEDKRRTLDYEVFRDRARLSRQPIEPPSAALHWVLVFAFVVVESIANAPFLAAGNSLGLVGGLSAALAIAAGNVFLAARAGVILRYVNHVNLRVRAAALAFGAGYGVFLLAFHLAVGHYRNALAGLVLNVAPGEAGRAALAALTQIPFSLLTIESWALALIGITFAVIAVVAGYRSKDPYPGYSEVAARKRAAAAALREHKDGYLVGLNAVFEGEPGRGGRPGVEAQLKQVRQDALQAISAHRASVAVTGGLLPQLHALASQVEASRTYCIARYRMVYRGVSKTAPARWAVPVAALAVPETPDLAAYTPAVIDETARNATVVEAYAAALQKARELQRKYLDGAPTLFTALGLERGEATVPAPGRGLSVAAGAPAGNAAAAAGGGNGAVKGGVLVYEGGLELEPALALEPVSEAPMSLREPVTGMNGRRWFARRGAVRERA